MQKQKKYLAILVALAMVLSTISGLSFWPVTVEAASEIFTDDTSGLSYEKTNDYIRIRWSNGASDITVPAYIDGLPVKEICENAFRSSNVKTVWIEDGIEQIDNYAFNSQIVRVPDSVTKFGTSSVFGNSMVYCNYGSACYDLVSDSPNPYLRGNTLSPSRTMIDCRGLDDETVKKMMKNGSLVYDLGDGKELYYAISSKEVIITGCSNNISKLEIPSVIDNYKVTSVADYAFNAHSSVYGADITNLVDVTLPNTLKIIGKSPFTGTYLKAIVLPDSIEAVDSSMLTFTGYSSIDVWCVKESYIEEKLIEYYPSSPIVYHYMEKETTDTPTPSLIDPDKPDVPVTTTTTLDFCGTPFAFGENAWNLGRLLNSSDIPDKDLAKICLILSSKAEVSKDALEGDLLELGLMDNVDGLSEQEASKHRKHYSYDGLLTVDKDKRCAAHTFAIKKYTSGTKTYNIITVVCRGTKMDISPSGLLFGTDYDDLYSDLSDCGFLQSAACIYEDLEQFLSDNKIDINAENNRYLITGHSLGAASANLLEYMLLESGCYANDITCYTYACPFTVWSNDHTPNTYGFAMNFLRDDDIVTHFSNSYEDFKTCVKDHVVNLHPLTNLASVLDLYTKKQLMSLRYGRDIQLGGLNEKTKEYYKKYHGKNWEDIEVPKNHICETYMASLMTDIENGTFGATVKEMSKHRLVSIYCPVDVEVIDQTTGSKVAEIKDNKIIASDEDVDALVVGDSKFLRFDLDKNYTVNLTATDDGELTYIVEDLIYNESGEYMPTTIRYDDIELTSGKLITNEISGDLPADEQKLFIVNESGEKTKEILEDGKEVAVDDASSEAGDLTDSEETNRGPGAGVRLICPLSGIVGETYSQKVLNISDAGHAHELHYTCIWQERDMKDLGTDYYGDWPCYKDEVTLTDELPSGLVLSNDGTILGSPTKPGRLRIWFNISLENSTESFSTMPSDDDIYNGFYDAVRFEIYDKNDTRSGHREIGDDPVKIKVNEDFVLPANKEMWYEFVSPSDVLGNLLFSYMSTDYTLNYGKGYDGIYDKNGYRMSTGEIDSSFLVSAGETYYLHLNNQTDTDQTVQITSFGEGMTVSEYIQNAEGTLSPFEGTIELVQKNVEKSFAGDDNKIWDVYKMTESWDMDKGILPWRFLYYWNSYAVVAPYQVHFGQEGFDFQLKGEYQIISKNITDATIGAFSSVSVPDGMSLMGQSNLTYLCSDAGVYGAGSYSYEVYVPAGKRLKDNNGVWWDDASPVSSDSSSSGNGSNTENLGQSGNNGTPGNDSGSRQSVSMTETNTGQTGNDSKVPANNEDISSKNTTIAAVNISLASISGIKKSYEYTGREQKPAPVVEYSGKTLKNGTDYVLEYSSNKKVGTAKIVITGKGSYTGVETVTFKIRKAENPLKLKVTSKSYKRTKLKKAVKFSIDATRGEGKVSYALNSATKKAKLKVTAKGKVTVPKNCKKGIYKIIVKATGNANYKKASKTVRIVVK